MTSNRSRSRCCAKNLLVATARKLIPAVETRVAQEPSRLHGARDQLSNVNQAIQQKPGSNGDLSPATNGVGDHDSERPTPFL